MFFEREEKYKMDIEKEAEKLAKEMVEKMQFPEKSKDPIVLVFGGFQGSGKTTIIDLLKDDLNLVVISSDEVRHKMFEKKYVLNDKFRKVVKETRYKIFKKVLRMGHSVVLDDNYHPVRLEEIKDYLNNRNESKYRLISVCLKTSKEELIRRIDSREPRSGKYQGKVYELEGSIEKYREIDQGKYDLVVNTEELGPDEIAEIVKDYV
jgi:cytidylate kinase